MKDTPLDIHGCLEFLLNNKGMTVYGLSKELGFDKPAKLYSILNRRTRPSYATLTSLTSQFEDLNGDWLLRGTGEPFHRPDRELSNSQLDSLKERNRQLEKQVADRDDTIELLRQQVLILREMVSHAQRNGAVRGSQALI